VNAAYLKRHVLLLLSNRLPLPPFAKLARLCVMDDRNQIDFDASASLRKWPSFNSERITDSLYAGAYLLIEGTLDDCIREFMALRNVARILVVHLTSIKRLGTTI
jgi:hypothetical protein